MGSLLCTTAGLRLRTQGQDSNAYLRTLHSTSTSTSSTSSTSSILLQVQSSSAACSTAVYSRFSDAAVLLLFSFFLPQLQHGAAHTRQDCETPRQFIPTCEARGRRHEVTAAREMHARAIHRSRPASKPVPHLTCPLLWMAFCFIRCCKFCFPVPAVPGLRFSRSSSTPDSRITSHQYYCTHVATAVMMYCRVALPRTTRRRHSSMAYLSLIPDPDVRYLVVEQQYSKSAVVRMVACWILIGYLLSCDLTTTTTTTTTLNQTAVSTR